jgi:hypothetical protein
LTSGFVSTPSSLLRRTLLPREARRSQPLDFATIRGGHVSFHSRRTGTPSGRRGYIRCDVVHSCRGHPRVGDTDGPWCQHDHSASASHFAWPAINSRGCPVRHGGRPRRDEITRAASVPCGPIRSGSIRPGIGSNDHYRHLRLSIACMARKSDRSCTCFAKLIARARVACIAGARELNHYGTIFFVRHQANPVRACTRRRELNIARHASRRRRRHFYAARGISEQFLNFGESLIWQRNQMKGQSLGDFYFRGDLASRECFRRTKEDVDLEGLCKFSKQRFFLHPSRRQRKADLRG